MPEHIHLLIGEPKKGTPATDVTDQGELVVRAHFCEYLEEPIAGSEPCQEAEDAGSKSR